MSPSEEVNTNDTSHRGDIEPLYSAAPGTEILYDIGAADKRGLEDLQHLKKGDTHILLVPQPSLTDPNDPLRWPLWKKYATFANAIAYSFLGGVTGPIMSAMMIPFSEEFNQPLQKISYANGATLVCQGVGNVLWMPLALKFGRRPVYLASNTLMGVACIWLGVASESSYSNLVVARAFLGLWEAPIESIVPSTIRDLFFLHHRGTFLSIYALSVLGGNELGPMFSAIIFQALGSKWAFDIVGFFIFATTITMFFFMPETLYLGQRPIITLSGETAVATESLKVEEQKPESSTAVTQGTQPQVDVEMTRGEEAPKRSFVRDLTLFDKPNPDANLLRDFLRPFILLTYPTVLWACVIYGNSLGWNVIVGATAAQLFAPQYNFDSQAQGLIFLSLFIGSLVGTWLCGPLADWIANYFTIRNRGIREPEMRLPTCIIAAVLTFIGALITGLTYNANTHWIGPVFGLGMLTAGAQMGATLSMNYALDCHAQLSVELMVTVASMKSLLAWIYTWVINEWVDSNGALTVYMVIATINVAFYLTTVPCYIYGKRVRLWIARVDLLGKTGLKNKVDPSLAAFENSHAA